MKTKFLFRLIVSVTMMLVMATMIAAANDDPPKRYKTEPNWITQQKVIPWTRRKAPKAPPIQCGIWVEVGEPPEDAEMIESTVEDFAEKDESLIQETIITEPDPVDVELLAIAIYCEAGADYISDATRYMVGDVVLNRVADERFPDSIEGVLTQKSQYGRFYCTGVVWPERASIPNEAHAVQRAYDTARAILTGEHSELYGNGYIFQSENKQSPDSIYRDGIWFGR